MTVAAIQHAPVRPTPPIPAETSRRQRQTARRRRAHQFGVGSERFVAAFLRAGDYAVLGHRTRVGRSEVDLIVTRDDVVAFVEVKARKRSSDGLEAVTMSKRKRLTRAANAWLSENDNFADCSIRFDIALVGANQDLEYLENAFEAVEDDEFVF